MARKVPVYDRDGNVLRHVSRSEARAMVDGHLASSKEFHSELMSVRLTRRERNNRLPIGSTITQTEVEMNAGLHGDPLMGDDDPIQAARDKIALWPFIGSDRNFVVRPRTRQADVDRATEVLRRADRPRRTA